MSDSPQQPPEPTKPPQTPPLKPVVSQTSKTLQQVIQTLQQVWHRLRPVLKAQSIKILRLAIRGLESLLAKLEAVPPASPDPAVAAPDPAPSVTGRPAVEDPDLKPPAASAESLGRPSGPEVTSLPERLQTGWSGFLSQIRSRLPLPWSQKLSDPALTGLIVGMFVLLIGTTSAILPSGQSATTHNLPSPKKPPANLSVPPELSAPVTPTSPQAESEAVAVSPPATAQAPPLAPLTPEQQRTAKLQEQVTDIGNQYTDGLVQFLQVDFPGHQLRVTLNDGWYNLSSEEQDRLVNEILHQAQEVNLDKLDVTNRQGALLARNPLVGQTMVVLQRRPTLSPEKATV